MLTLKTEVRQMAKDTSKKLRSLWGDKRPYFKRVLLLGSAMLAMCYTFIFFGPLEMVAFGAGTLDYSYKDVLTPLGIFAAIILIAGTLLTALLRGKIFNYTLTVIFSLTVSGYIQGALLNGSLGTLTGESVDWAASRGVMWLDMLFWVAVLIIMLFVMYLSRKVWKSVIIAVSMLLVVMQAAPTVAIVTGAYEQTKTEPITDYYMSIDKMFDYSPDKNTFVFVLDYMDYSFIEEIAKSDADFFDGLDGFTGYTDATSTFCRTQPALSNVLTGNTDLAYNVTAEEFYKESWTADGKDILKDIDSKGYDIQFFSSPKFLFSDPSHPEKYISNFQNTKASINYPTLIGKMLTLSSYRYAPIALKPFYWADTHYYNKDIFDTSSIKRYTYGDGNYKTLFTYATTELDKNGFKFYHFNGSHPPQTLKEDGTYSDTPTDAITQTKGVFNILFGAFKRMKELGIYDNATIIITADHGDVNTLVSNELTPIKIGMFYKPAGSAGAAFKWSNAQVSNANIPATIIKSTGADYSKYGKALDDIAEGENVVRKFYRIIMNTSDWLDDGYQIYEITGPASDKSNWKLASTHEVKHKFY